MTTPRRVEIAMARGAMAWGQPIPPAVEVKGRGYSRVPTGPLELARPPDIALWQNVLPIHWPQAIGDWGQVLQLALTLPDNGDIVAATYPVSLYVRAGQQPRIAAGDLLINGVGPNTRRPYGVGQYSLSFYGMFPAIGQIWAFVALLGWAWERQADECEPWPAAPAIVAGGCA
jgi:hypothetical protein